MKLNLLPTYVGKGKQLTLAIVFGVMLIAASAGATVVMISNANSQLERVKEQANAYVKPIDDAIEHASKAATIIAPLQDVVRNINLAKAMTAHNPKYPDFYNSMFPMIPEFFRVTNMQVSPTDGQTVTLRMTGVLKTEEQYRDLMLALLRIEGARTITRSGFTRKTTFLPGVSEVDQNPVAPKLGEDPLPKDPLQRMGALIARANEGPFVAPRGYGGGPGERGAMPDHQEVTVTVLLQHPKYNLLVPNPSATLGVGATRGGGGGRRGRGE
jgi:hypothetical protein